MAQVVLVRHGETQWNRDRRVQGWAPVALTDRGHDQAERLADRYAADRLLASDLRRTLETARVTRLHEVSLTIGHYERL